MAGSKAESRQTQISDERLDDVFTNIPPSELKYSEDEPKEDTQRASGNSFDEIGEAFGIVDKQKPTNKEQKQAGKVFADLKGTELLEKLPESVKSKVSDLIDRYPIPEAQKEQFMNKYRKQKFILSAALLIAATTSAFAQGNGLAGINEATSMVTSYFDPGTKLIYAVGAVVGLIGGVKVYGKFSSGDPDTSKTAASWFGACIFLIVAATILRSFFL